jgi:hypothetical protein
VGKQYQTRDAEASMAGLVVSDEVTVALAEIAESAKEGLLALAVGAGLHVIGTLMEESVVALAGPRASMTPTGSRFASGAMPRVTASSARRRKAWRSATPDGGVGVEGGPVEPERVHRGRRR